MHHSEVINIADRSTTMRKKSTIINTALLIQLLLRRQHYIFCSDDFPIIIEPV